MKKTASRALQAQVHDAQADRPAALSSLHRAFQHDPAHREARALRRRLERR